MSEARVRAACSIIGIFPERSLYVSIACRAGKRCKAGTGGEEDPPSPPATSEAEAALALLQLGVADARASACSDCLGDKACGNSD